MKLSVQQKPFWFVLLLSGLTVLTSTIILSRGYRQTGQWQSLVLAIIAGLVGLIYCLAVWLAGSKRRYQISLWLVIIARILAVVLTPLFLADFWLVGLIILVAVPLEIGLAGKLHHMPLFVIFALVGASAMLIVDLLALPDRLTILAAPQFVYLRVGISVLYFFMLAFLLWYFRLRAGATFYARPNLITQLSLVFTVISVLSISIVTGVLIIQIRQAQIIKVGFNFQTKAEIEAERVGNILERQIVDLSNLGQSLDITARLEEIRATYPDDKDEIRQFLLSQEKHWQQAAENSDFVLQYRTGPAVMTLTAFRGSHNSHKNLFLTDRMGGLVAVHGEKPERFFYGDEDWWQAVWNLGQSGIYLGQLSIDPDTKDISIFIAVRIINSKTFEPVGVLASTYELQAVRQIIDLANENTLQQVILLSPGGVMLASPDKQDIGQPVRASLLETGILSTQSNSKETSNWLLAKDSQEHTTVLAYSNLNNTSQTNLDQIRRLGWKVMVSDTQANALAEVNRSTKVTSLVGLLVLVGIVVVANITAKIITAPVKELTATAREINEGNLDLQAKPGGPLEFATLAETFNSLTARLNTFINNLRQSEKKYRTLFEDSKDTIYLTDPSGQIIDANPAGLSLFGYTGEEAKNENVVDVYANPDDRFRLQQEMDRHGSIRDFEVKLRKKDGAEIDCLVTATARRAGDGAILGYQGLIRDITAQKQAEKERLRLSAIQRELEVAQNIQASLLPPAHPEWSGPDVVCYSQPAREVGGDFYTYHALAGNLLVDGRPIAGGFALTVGDVSGKGMPAALLMAVSLSSLQAVIDHSFRPSQLLAHLDQVITLYTQSTRQNCALCYAEFIPSIGQDKGGKLHVANAGCVSPIIRRVGAAVEWVDVGGIPLGAGLGAEFGYQEVSLNLSKGDLVILTSDGLVEANNAAGELFSFERLEQAVANGPTTGAGAMLEHLRREVAAFVGQTEPHDDMTIVVVQV